MKNRLSMLILLISVALIAFGSLSCGNPLESSAAKVGSITVGMEATAVNSLIYIADDQGYFAAHGLDLAIKDYASGLAAVNGMLANEVDVATAAEFVVVGKAFAKERIRAFASIDRFLHNYIIGRKDRGIATPADLEGKRIGVPLKTAAEFYLGRFLDLDGMSVGQVTLVDLPPARALDAITSGEVDAVVAWQPNAKIIEDRLGGGIVKWPAQNEQATYCVALSTEDWANGHPEQITRFLRAVAEAEQFSASHPDEARAIVKKRLQYDDAYAAAVWPEHQLSVTLEQALVLAMEDEARWMITNNLTSEKTTPDFLEYIYVDGLNSVRPNSVNIIR